MRKLFLFSIIAVNTIVLLSCGGNTSGNSPETDSLRLVTKQQQELLDDLTSAVVDLSANLDSIKKEEGIITSGVDENGSPLSKKVIMAKLDGLKMMVDKKKSQLVNLEEKVNSSNGDIKKLKSVIHFLNSELAQKDRIIDELKTELSSKNADIKKLDLRISAKEEEVTDLTSEVQEKESQLQEKENQLQTQSSTINEVYYLIGTKSDLQKMGVITGTGLLQKKKVNLSNLDKSQFKKADMRALSEIEIPAPLKKIEIMTGNPKSAYSIESIDKSHSILHINNPESFWSTIKFLIVKI